VDEGVAPVIVEARDHKLYMVLNRPAALNAQNQPMRQALVEAIDRLEQDPELLVGIIYGVGGRAFSAGADLKEVMGSDFGDRRPRPEPHRPDWVHFEAVRWAAKPLIAAIDGYCLGGGLELANYCDIRIATEASRFGQPEPRTVGGPGGPALHQLPRTLPIGESLLLQLTSQPMEARRAYELGLVQRLCADRESLLAEADAIADQMIECNADALRTIKRVVRWGSEMSSEQAEKVHLLIDEIRWSERTRASRSQPPVG
jgi:enoyl-CoA hydratase/carnithine racemase